MNPKVTDMAELQAIARALGVEPRSNILGMLDESLDGFLACYRRDRGAGDCERGLDALLTELNDLEGWVRCQRKQLMTEWVLLQLPALKHGRELPKVLALALQDSPGEVYSVLVAGGFDPSTEKANLTDGVVEPDAEEGST